MIQWNMQMNSNVIAQEETPFSLNKEVFCNFPRQQFRFSFARQNVDMCNLRTTRVATKKRRTIRIVRDRERVSLENF